MPSSCTTAGLRGAWKRSKFAGQSGAGGLRGDGWGAKQRWSGGGPGGTAPAGATAAASRPCREGHGQRCKREHPASARGGRRLPSRREPHAHCSHADRLAGAQCRAQKQHPRQQGQASFSSGANVVLQESGVSPRECREARWEAGRSKALVRACKHSSTFASKERPRHPATLLLRFFAAARPCLDRSPQQRLTNKARAARPSDLPTATASTSSSASASSCATRTGAAIPGQNPQ